MHRCWLSLSATQIRQAGGFTVAQELDTMMTDTEALLLDCNTFLQELWNYMETLNDKLGNDYVPLLDIDSVLSSNMDCMCKALNWKWTMHHAINGYMELQAQMTPYCLPTLFLECTLLTSLTLKKQKLKLSLRLGHNATHFLNLLIIGFSGPGKMS